MTKLLPYPDLNHSASNINEAAGSAPVPGAGNQMTGNPKDTSDRQSMGQYVPGNQNSSAQLLATQLAVGAIDHNSVPTNVNAAPGTDSLLAQLSRGQVVLTDTTYGQSAFIPGNAGAGNANVPSAVPVTTRQASGLAYPAPAAQVFTGD